MTETTLSSGAAVTTRTRQAYRLTWWGSLRSELVKILSTASTRWTSLAAGILMAFVGVVAASASGRAGTPGAAGAPGVTGTDSLGLVLAGQTPVVLLMAVLGVMVGAREYGSGMARTTYAAVPRRLSVLSSRAAALTLVVTPTLVAGTVVAFVGGGAVLDSKGAAGVSWGDADVPRVLLGVVGYLLGAGLLGLFLGTLTRSIGSGVGSVIGLLLVLPGIAQLLLPESWETATRLLPSQAGSSFTALHPASTALSPGAGAAVFVAWVLLAGIGSGWTLLRRDV